MADVLEFSDIQCESRGYMSSGRLKMTDQNIVFKSNKTGKVDQINMSDIDLVNLQRFVGSFGLRIFLKNGLLHRFMGFKTGEEEKISNYFKKTVQQDLLEKELSLRGWNWGTVNFNGAVLSLDCERKTSFEIPLNNVSQCTTGKNEVTLEFHQNDDCPINLMEMRFHVPISESADVDPVEAFHANVMKQASVISVSGDAIAIFREIPCLTPRGRYDIKMFPTFFQLHGKTFDYKIPMSTVLRLFLLPHKDNRQMFFVLSLDPPIKQGQTRYPYLVFQFNNDDETNIELPFTDEELATKYENKLTRELSGPVYEVLGKIMKVLINRKLTGPGSFIGHSGTPAISASYKAAAGYLYPLERGFIYVHKPPLHIRFEELANVNFARGGGSTRSFDFEIELKSGTLHTFSSIVKEEYVKLFDFVTSKKLNVKNTGKTDSYKDDFGDSDNENEPDAYLARVKQEAQERSDEDDEDSESTDEDFNPDKENVEDIADEYDSNVGTTDSDSDEDGSNDEAKAKRKEKKEKQKARKERPERKESSKPRKKKERDDNKPKRATTAFMLWLNDTREQIKSDNPGIKVTEIAKKGGEMWRELTDKSIWEEKANKDKERYAEEMKSYKPSDSGGSSGKKRKKAEEPSPSKKAATSTMTGAGFKSKEYIESDGSSDNSDKEDGGKSKKKQKTSDKKKKDKKAASDDEDDADASTPEESEEEEDDDESDDGSD